MLARWTAACTIGELLGFGGIPVAGAALGLWATANLAAESRSLILYAIAVVGGLGEGAVLAGFQFRVLRRVLPGLAVGRWVGGTAAAASLAWACGMLAPTLDDLVGLTAPLQVAIWVPAGLFILVSIGGAQALALRGLVDRPWRWLRINVLAWLAGLVWTFLLPALLPETSPPALWVTAFVVAGVLMGLTVGLVTGRMVLAFAREAEI